MKYNRIILLLCLILCVYNIKAQQYSEVFPFKAGEVLTYDMHIKIGIISAKAGRATLTVDKERYDNQDAYRFSLIARSGGIAKSVFAMEDTLLSYATKEVKPLAYLKDAHEAGDHTIERAYYTHKPGKVEVSAKRIKNDELRVDTLLTSSRPVYDMLSIVYYARTFDYASLEKGARIPVSYFTGRRMESMQIEYRGIQSVRANDGRDYNCFKLVLLLDEKAFEDKDAAMTVYLSSDQNKVPIRIDSKLKIGTTRIIMSSYQL